MKKITLLFVFFTFIGIQLFAQTTITGTVIDEDGMGVPGATVRVKGYSDIGTITDLDGNYTLSNVPSAATTIVFSFVGLETLEQSIAGKTVLNATLNPADQVVDEVVVTAIGIKRSEKKIGYAATTVSNEELTATKDRSALNALQGKVAGVNITSASGAPGSSSRVIFRGFSTFYGSNQPLYVINGVPINNTSSGSSDLNGGTDFGNKANDINPENIESITFLKGSAATALYGSRAANGVIVITTKKGEDTNSGMEVQVSSTVKFSTPLRLPQLQNVYGQGIFGNWDQRENTSYGPKFDNEMHYWGHVVDGQRLIKPYSALPTNVADFFEVGHTYQNSVSLMGGNEAATYFLSYSNVSDDGIMPYDQDSYKRNTLSLSGSAQLSNNISTSASIDYVNKKNTFVPTGQGGQSVWNNVLQQPRDIPILELANYKDPFYDLDTYYGLYTSNPYFALLENGNSNNEDRVYGMGDITYQVNDYISFMFRVGTDVSNEQLKEWRAKKVYSDDSFNSTVDVEEGAVSHTTRMYNQLNTDFIVTFAKSFGDMFDLSILAGHNFNQRSYEASYLGVTGIDIEEFYHVSNSYGTPAISEYSYLRRLIGVYGNAELSFKGWLNLTLNSRNDWSSTLPLENNSFYYPGVALGFVFTDAIPAIQTVIPFGKLRAAWGQTGNDAAVYEVYPYFFQPGRFPLPNNVNAFSLGDQVANPELQPEISTEIELGTDLRFFNNRLKIDFTVYDKTITDLIFNVDLPASSGFGYQTMNLGEINNKGIETLIEITPVDKKNFSWDFSINFSKNKSTLVKLNNQLDKVDLMGLLGGTEHWFRAYPMYDENNVLLREEAPIGIFEVSAPEIYTDAQGVEHTVVDAQGIPKLANEGYIEAGKSEYDYMIGINNSISIYNVVTIAATVDWRQGGLMHSRTAGMVYFTGISPITLYNDRQPFIVPNSVIQVGEDGDGNPVYVENTKPVLYDVLGGSASSYWDVGGTKLGTHEMVSKSFVKLRSLTVNFVLPDKWLEKTMFGSASFGFVGSNLLMWTPEENRFIDPELTTYGNDLTADFGEFGATPSVRSVGFNLSFTF